MTEAQIIELARQFGWNVEHAQTNKMLVSFARAVLLFEPSYKQINSHEEEKLRVYSQPDH